MRILLISQRLGGRGGIETAIKLFSKGLTSTSVCKIKLVIVGNLKSEHDKNWFENIDVHVIALPLITRIIPLVRSFYLKVQLQRVINDWQPDISLGLTPKMIGLLRKVRKRATKSYLIYSWIHFSVSKLKHPNLICCADRHLAISSGIKQELMRELGIAEKNIYLIYNPIEFTSTKIKRNFSNPKIILSIGRLTDQKNHALLIKAFSRLAVESNLHIVGSGPLEGELKTLVNALNLEKRVFFHGWQKNVWDWVAKNMLEGVSIFVLSSNHEGFPFVLIEALSKGIFSISTDCKTGPREIIKETSGKLVPVNDEIALFRAMQDSLEKIKEFDSPEDIAKTVRKFDLNQYATTLITVFHNDLLSN